MRESSGGEGLRLPDDQGLAHVVDEGSRRTPDRPLLSRQAEDGWQDITCAEFAQDVRRVGRGLIEAGVRRGDRVAVLGNTCYEWALADFAVLSIGAITVPIYPTASEEQVRHIATDSGAAWCFAESADQRQELVRIGGDAWRVWEFADLADWRADEVSDAVLDERRAQVRADHLATIVYTSGTTGVPKGCMLTHRNMFAASAASVEHLGQTWRTSGGEQASTLLVLPLSHIFGRTILGACLYAGTRTALLPGFPALLGALSSFRPSLMGLVPYALEKIRKAARKMGVDPAVESIAIEAGRAHFHGQPIPAEIRAECDRLNATVFATLREGLGGRWTHVISGGASLDETTALFFRGIGVNVLGAYGLTEAATAVTINPVEDNRINSSGRPVPGVTVALSEDEEVLVRGLNVTPGYWPGVTGGDPLAVHDVDTGWLRTGDLGRLDEDGYLYITGRRKEILVTSSGKNISPTQLEDRVRLHPLVSNCLVVGNDRPFVSALITLDPVAAGKWAADNGLDLQTPGWTEDPGLTAELGSAVDEANALVSRAESIREFRVLETDFSLDAGHLTPSMKLRRTAIECDHAEVIESMYSK
ncbi:AMP-dependent synthetase/ligase [Saccharopolyspora mangrovi]|uniref:AMP-dependent synthetase/ligase n=1 Tax=Saccharopolyspora mangrovi TaxID=3082379 RepID=A0ABU6AHX8_9PSEU|nr:AMP-dependent synthetase/ligase [Saccharopolyspora sp. S2-29]MEB3370979.1 AMP-dependent synthetase/ligase [Saccharopolyspora sp. S2-29]